MSNLFSISRIPGFRSNPSCLGRWTLPGCLAAMLVPSTVFAETAADAGASNSILFYVAFALGVIGVSVMLILGLTRWGHKQDQIHAMMPFRIKYLVESKNESEKIDAAMELGDARDPNALLVLVSIVSDENSSEDLRRAAGIALKEMSRHYPRYTAVINDCLAAVEEKDREKLIELLIENFENKKETYAQSAYLIGREQMRIKQYIDARIWLQYARARNRKSRVGISQISELITACNQLLFDEGDGLYKEGEYHDALECYALASHKLPQEEKRHYSARLRMACVHCKLHHYDDAYQETLYALQERLDTDISGRLSNLLQQMRRETGNTEKAQAQRDRLDAEITGLVEKTMAELIGSAGGGL